MHVRRPTIDYVMVMVCTAADFVSENTLF